MINQERVKLLIEVLRNPNSKQAFNHLETTETEERCCLGHACRVAMANGLVMEVEKRLDDDLGEPVTSFDGDTGLLPPVVREWFGFDDNNPELQDEKLEWSTASTLNDGDDETSSRSLSEIADAFERTFIIEH